ncbi:MAG: gluconate 2-dehydrogenase subunit 3 family protein [Chloroflexota bacterium]|nr:gluconate 2-dehydrogenase subunit 3 family protein [Chloroflexota bacterium]
MPGTRFPGADSLGERGHWDAATRQVVLDRVHNVPPYRHFGPHAQRTIQALCERVLPQDARPPERRIPLAPWIDERCASAGTTGFEFDDMPLLTEAWDQGLAGIDETARARHGRAFADLDDQAQTDVLHAIRLGAPEGATWQVLPARRWWVNVAVRQITAVYYAHPEAWDEIGFGGPAYPRGYAALNHGGRESWESREAGADRRRDLERLRQIQAVRLRAEASGSNAGRAGQAPLGADPDAPRDEPGDGTGGSLGTPHQLKGAQR